jgi:propanediol dehydratase small subunit
VPVELDPATDYPLGTRRPDLVRTPSGLPLDRVTLPAARAGELVSPDVRATPETLALQAEVARKAGRPQLADGLERASELASVPDDELLEIYTALRPGRSTPDELEAWAVRLDELGARRTASFVREAATVYVERGLAAE